MSGGIEDEGLLVITKKHAYAGFEPTSLEVNELPRMINGNLWMIKKKKKPGIGTKPTVYTNTIGQKVL
jgi:hypothetical protein